VGSTEPLTGARYPVSGDAASIAAYFQNLAMDLGDDCVPRFATATARDNAYNARVTAGYPIADGMVCVVAGRLYRRIGGSWRLDQQRGIVRSVTPTAGSAAEFFNGGAETGVTSGAAGLAGFTLYEAGTILVNATFNIGVASAPGAALGTVKIDGTQVGNTAVSRVTPWHTVSSTGLVTLAAGAHSIAFNVSTSGGVNTSWTGTTATLLEVTAE
jgi:hypothetical protein